MSRLRAFDRLSWSDKLLFVAAAMLMALASAAIRVVPLGHMVRYLGNSLGPVGFVPLASARAHHRALRVRDAIGRAATALPLRSDCYPQALAGVILCRMVRVPVAMHLGVKLGECGAMKAHAWLVSGRVGITGRKNSAGFTPVACFFVRSSESDH